MPRQRWSFFIPSVPFSSIVSGDFDLLDLNEHQGVRIVTAAQALRIIAGD